MDTLIMVSIMTMMIFSTFATTRAATLLVSNELKRRGDVPVFVTCHPTPWLSKLVPLGQKLLIEIPTTAGDNAVDEKAAGFRPWRPTTCIGTFFTEKHISGGTRHRTFCTIRTKMLRSVKTHVSSLSKTMDFIVGTTIREESGTRFFLSFG
ncbi:unnamed protein product, partial [Arabidopsis halleri]